MNLVTLHLKICIKGILVIIGNIVNSLCQKKVNTKSINYNVNVNFKYMYRQTFFTFILRSNL